MAYKNKKSFMIGDKVSDKICAKKSKLYFEFAEKNFLIKLKELSKKVNNYLLFFYYPF